MATPADQSFLTIYYQPLMELLDFFLIEPFTNQTYDDAMERVSLWLKRLNVVLMLSGIWDRMRQETQYGREKYPTIPLVGNKMSDLCFVSALHYVTSQAAQPLL